METIQKNIQRLLFFLLFAAVIVIKVPILLVYGALFYLSFEFLNRNQKYLKLKDHNTYNWFFLSFFVFIVLVRAKIFDVDQGVAFHLNSLEHVGFAAIVCLTLVLYLNILTNVKTGSFKVLGCIFLAFNLIGLVNEYFQNFFQQKPVFLLQPNDIKDLVVNLIGSGVYVLSVCVSKLKN